MSQKEQLVLLFLLAEKAERCDDMLRFICELAKSAVPLTDEDRNLLSVAFKNSVGALRSSSRCLIMLQDKAAKDPLRLQCLDELRENVVVEMTRISNTLIDLVDNNLLSKELSPSNEVFYIKMKGDYLRYLAECLTGDERKKASQAAKEAYDKALDIANEKLPPSSSVRLGLCLNFSVFYYEILGDVPMAKKITQEALNGIMDTVKEDNEINKDQQLIAQLLKDNLTLWDSDIFPSSGDEEASTEKDK